MKDLKPQLLPVWWTGRRDSPADDPIGCPVSIEEMIAYLNAGLPFVVRPPNFEFISKGEIETRWFWLWAFYGDDGHRWNLIVFSESPGPAAKTQMCADNNPYRLNDRDYVAAIHNQEY